MNLNPKIFIALTICMALFGMLLFRMVSNSAAGVFRILLKFFGFLIMIGGVVLTILLWTGKIG